MGKCVSKHPSVLTIALSEKDIAAANQIWSKFAASSDYIVALKDEQRNQFCEQHQQVVSNKHGDSRKHNYDDHNSEHDGQNYPKQQQQQWEQVENQQQQRNENKSGQWTINAKIKHDQDYDDVVVVDDGNDIAAVLVAKSSTSSCHIAATAAAATTSDAGAGAGADIALLTANSRNGSHKIGQEEEEQREGCLPHLRLQRHDCVAADSNNNAASVNVASDKNDKNHENNKHKQRQREQQQKQQMKKRQKVKHKLQLINCVVAHEPETDAEDGAERLNCNSNCHEQQSNADDEKQLANFAEQKDGQTESKKHAKKLGNTTAIETKGTAMSFGFRKKLNTTPKKFKKLLEGDTGKKKQQQDKCNNISEGDRCESTVDKVGAVIDAEMGGDSQEGFKDDNGNAVKRRSKSAHAGRTLTSDADVADSGAAPPPKINQPKTITFNLNQNSTIEYQRRQFFQQPTGGTSGRVAWPAYHAPTHTTQQQQQQPIQRSNIISTGMHTNVIVRPTPRAPPASYSKFTLHTVSLPRPEFPVAISLSANTPTTPGSTYTPSPTIVTTAGAKGTHAKEHPLTAVAVANVAPAPSHMDLKTAKQMANNTRRGFSGSREISADSGIASMDMALDSSTSSAGGRTASPKRSRSRPRNLQMIMNGRHKFEVRDLDDPLSSESNSFVEPLALPKLPTENQTVPLPLCGLVRSNTVLSRENYERNGGSSAVKQVDLEKSQPNTIGGLVRNPSEESESVDEEKLYLDRSTSEKSNKHHQFKDINTFSSKTSSPGSSIMLSWCNAGESLAVKDCSSLSISSSEDSNKLLEDKHEQRNKTTHMLSDLNDDDLSTINTDMQISTISSITETLPNTQARDSNVEAQKLHDSLAKIKFNADEPKPDRPNSLYNALNESKFAEMALAGSTYLLDDETSPTDSLVSSTESEEAASKQKKHKINEELQEKDIDEISPELEMGSPISPGTPTHASHSLSLSDCGNLIDDEIADQPALLFNSETQEGLDSMTASRKEKTDTPTLMETISLRSLKSQSKARSVLQQAIELSLRTPLSLRKAVMERAESLDTLSPCESICSDDLMMDFDMNSSVDSIDRSGSIKSRSGSDLNKIGETELFSELERKGSDVMKELNTIMRIHTNRNTEKDSVIAHLPARATRLLNRSRLQQQCPLTNADSDSSKSPHSIRGRSAATSRASTASNSTHTSQQRSAHHHHHHSHQQRELHSSSDDLMLYDKSFRNAMIQDVLQFKKQLLRLRRVLQEDEEFLMRTETLNPFENDNGQLFASCGLDSKLLSDIDLADLASLTSSTTDDPIQELNDLRRQVVYLQGQVEDRDRTIRLQRNHIENLEAAKAAGVPALSSEQTKECINMATQTERTRPLSIGQEGLSRSKPEYTSYTTHFPAVCGDTTTIIHHQQQCPAAQQTRRHTIISTTLTNYHNQQQQQQQQQQQLAHAPRRASIAWEKPTTTTTANQPTAPTIYKPVKITLIGEPLKQWPWQVPDSDGECKRQLLNGNGNKTNGNLHLHGNKPLNGCGSTVPLANGVCQQQTAQQQKHQTNRTHMPQSLYKTPHTNGNFNPTVTIV